MGRSGIPGGQITDNKEQITNNKEQRTDNK
jgi:hypothetical protein